MWVVDVQQTFPLWGHITNALPLALKESLLKFSCLRGKSFWERRDLAHMYLNLHVNLKNVSLNHRLALLEF